MSTPVAIILSRQLQWHHIDNTRTSYYVGTAGVTQASDTGPTSRMTSRWLDQTSWMASRVPIPAPRGSLDGPNLAPQAEGEGGGGESCY